MADNATIAGTWSGVLEIGSQRLRLKLMIGEDGSASLVSLDQNAQPTSGRVTSRGAEIEIGFAAIGGRFTVRTQDTNRMEGVWQQSALELPLVFHRGEAALAPTPIAVLTAGRLAALRLQAGAPAMIAAVARGNATARIWVDGERAIGSGIAAQETDAWHLGSISKSMTATLVARLVDAGDVRWDDTVGDLLKTVVPDMNDAYRPVTLRHLLCHRSGLPKDIPLLEFMRFARELPDAREERKEFASIALALAPKGAMGATYEYSNNGYIVAGAMLEAKLNRSWEELMRRHLFEPLKLASAGFGAPGSKDTTDQPAGHATAPDGLRAHRLGVDVTDNPAALGPAGRVHMNMADLLQFLAAHRDRTALLRPETWRTLHEPTFGGDYAMGWIVRGDGTRWHNGSNTLWYAEASFNAATGIVAAAACNHGDLSRSPPPVGRALLEAIAAAG